MYTRTFTSFVLRGGTTNEFIRGQVQLLQLLQVSHRRQIFHLILGKGQVLQVYQTFKGDLS